MERKQFIQWNGMTILSAIIPKSFLFNGIHGDVSRPVDPELVRWISANDRQTGVILQELTSGKIIFRRKLGQDSAILASAFVTPSSGYYQSQTVSEKLRLLTSLFLQYQLEDGTVNTANLESPPDTAFLVELVAAARIILKDQSSAQIQEVCKMMDVFLKKTGEALVTGGVHTPNHRWVICSALSKLFVLYADQRYVHRIEEWLAEGIFMDDDGHYPERSAGIYAVVENNSLITMATFLSKSQLLEFVRKNLRMTRYYLEPNGDVVTNDSRRQDQYMESKSHLYYIQYRFLAILDGNPEFAAIANQIAASKDFEAVVMQKYYYLFLEHELLQAAMPSAVHPLQEYEKFFPTTQLLRIRRNDTSMTLFGGVDWPLNIASGRSNCPDFFAYRKGNAVMKSMRISTAFFNMGYFYSQGIRKKEDGYWLSQTMQAPYYQPLPSDKRQQSGDYALTPSTDGRFWNKMQFNDRPVSNVKEESIQVRFQENKGAVTLLVEVDGAPNVPITVELCFKEGGTLEGVRELGNDNFQMDGAEAVYRYGNDAIRFGPGVWQHEKIDGLEGERYSTHFGTLRKKGMHVFITGITPFRHSIMFG